MILGVCVWAGQAENAVGVSPWSALCHSATSATVPGQPAPPCVVASTPTTAQVQWIAPADGGAELTEYLLECDDGCAAHQPRTSSHNQVLPYSKSSHLAVPCVVASTPITERCRGSSLLMAALSWPSACSRETRGAGPKRDGPWNVE